MISDLLWVFKAHRAAFDRIVELERKNTELLQKLDVREKQLAVREDRYEQTIKDLEEQLARKPTLDIPQLMEELFQDQPYEGGKIPDDVWLTPGAPDR